MHLHEWITLIHTRNKNVECRKCGFQKWGSGFNKRREQGQTNQKSDTLWSQLQSKGVKIDDKLLSWWYFSTLNLPVYDLRNIFTQISILKEKSNSTKSLLDYAKDAARSHEAIDNLDKLSSSSTTLISGGDVNTLASKDGNGFNQYGVWRRCFNCRDTVVYVTTSLSPYDQTRVLLCLEWVLSSGSLWKQHQFFYWCSPRLLDPACRITPRSAAAVWYFWHSLMPMEHDDSAITWQELAEAFCLSMFRLTLP